MKDGGDGVGDGGVGDIDSIDDILLLLHDESESDVHESLESDSVEVRSDENILPSDDNSELVLPSPSDVLLSDLCSASETLQSAKLLINWINGNHG